MSLSVEQRAKIYSELEILAVMIDKIEAVVWEGFFKQLDQMIGEGKLSEGDKERLLLLIEEQGITSPRELREFLIGCDC